jgi:hypothetical protein
MLRIRRIFDLALPVDREAMRQVLEILRARLPGVSEESTFFRGLAGPAAI